MGEVQTGYWRSRPRLLIAALAVLFALSLVVASGAQAYIYWVNSATGSIGRANLDGTGINQNFITGLPGPLGVAVDPGRYDYYANLVPTDTHIYWTNGYGIGRANLDGSGKDVNFIGGLEQQPIDVAVYNMKAYVPGLPPPYYCVQENLVWTEAPWQGNAYAGSLIGSARVPGCMCQGTAACWLYEGWVHTLANTANAIAAGATDSDYGSDDSGYVYWSEMGGQSIGRANLAIDMPTVKEDFIAPTATNYTTSEGVAVRQENFCVTCGHIYWVNRSIFDLGGSIGRANLDGAGVNSNFINLLTGYSADTPQAVAVDPPKYDIWATPPLITTGAHIYWTMPNSGRIGRANLDGTGVKQDFITGAAKPWGIAVDAGGPPPPGAPQGTPNVAQTISAAGLPKGLASALTAKLRNAREAVRRHNKQAALNLVQAVIRQIEAQSGKAIPTPVADRLVADLNTISASIR